jgi:hypothetical protein
VLRYLLRRHGIDAALVVGAAVDQSDGFRAHAWVEVDGIVVNDRPDVRAHHQVLPDLIERMASL